MENLNIIEEVNNEEKVEEIEIIIEYFRITSN